MKNLRYIGLLSIFGLIAAIYAMGSGGSLYYDDVRPLGNLANVVDVDSAINYVTSESSGPLGRPLSMLTFLPHAIHWSESTQPIFWGNILIHLTCGLLVFLLTKLLLRLTEFKSPIGTHFTIASAAALLWLVLPIHAATVLIAIQRMAQLSTLFMLLGLCVYLIGLLKQQQITIDRRPIVLSSAIIWQVAGLLSGTFFAILSKENGILLPALILVIEVTLLRNCTGIDKFRKIRVLSGLLGLLLIVFLLVFYLFKTCNHPEGRDYTTFQRLISQPFILLDYIRLAFIPAIESINPFHDNYRFSKSAFELKTFFAITILSIAFLSAIKLRKTVPLFSFAVLWYFVAHLLESTTIALELVFLHRNYLALIGPIVALIIAAAKVKNVALVKSSFIGYTLVMTTTLGLTSNIWGDKLMAAETWFVAQQGSVRANEHLSNMLLKAEKFEESAKVTEHLASICDDCAGTKLQHAVSKCLAGDDVNINEVLASVQFAIADIKNANRLRGLPDQLVALEQFRTNGICVNIDAERLYGINLALAEHKLSHLFNPLRLIQNMYEISVSEKDFDDA
ncbi:MAG: hypothetical protein AAGJ37_16895, partial [Pseudomonadota bacterium]